MTLQKKYSLIFILFILLVSCKDKDKIDVSQDKIYAEYELFYDGNVNKTYAKAKFKLQGGIASPLKLNSPSDIYFQGESLPYNSALSIYEREISGFVDRGEFVWVDKNESKFTNFVNLRPISFQPIDTIPRTTSYELTWNGEPLVTGESISLVMTGDNGGIPQVLTLDQLGATSFVISRTALQDINPGMTEIYVERIYNGIPEQKTTAGGAVIAKVRAPTLNVYLK